jgi:anaphase-promoting complex subunit 2
MPELLQEQFSSYANEYAKIKRGRKLTWMDHLGTVEVEIELADRELTIEVSPVQASVLYAFEENGMSLFVGE